MTSWSPSFPSLGAARASELLLRFDKLFGFLVPLPIFMQVQGRLGLYSGGFVSEGLSVPLAYLVAPLAFLSAIPPFLHAQPMPRFPTLGGAMLLLWILVLGGWSSLDNPSAVLYTIQWASPLTMLVYGAMLAYDDRRREAFLAGFLPGTIAALVYLVGQGLFELLFMNSFRGRMSQNVVLPGMYQLYNYVPLGMVMCGLFAAGTCIRENGERRIGWAAVFAGATLLVPILTAARGSVALYGVAVPFLGWRLFGLRGAIWIMLVPMALLLLFNSESFLLLEKLAALQEESEYGGTFGNRDAMGRLYWQVYLEDPIFGTRFLPPILAFPELGINVKSAHNYYLDSLAWGGPVALLGVAMLVLGTLTMAGRLFVNFMLTRRHAIPESASMALAALPLAVGVLLVNSNLRIPLREPYTGVIGFILIGLMLGAGQRALDTSPSSASS